MGWGSAIGVVLLTTVAGAGAAALVAYFLIYWLEIRSPEGGSGYFFLYVVSLGVAGGFLAGLVSALAVPTSFWRAQGYALAALLALTVLGAVIPILLHDKAPPNN